MSCLDIAVVTETFPPEVNGVAMTLGRLVHGMRERGHRVSIVRPRQRRDDRGSEYDLTIAGVPMPGYAGLRFGLPSGGALARQWRRHRPDLVHVVTEGPLGWSAVSTARRLGIPVTSGFHTNFDHYSVHYGLGWLRPAVSAYLRALHRRTRATLVPTTALAADLAGEGVPGVRVVGRGVDTRLFNPRRRSTDLRAEWGAAPEDFVCLYVGRLAPEKNLVLAERAFAAIRGQHSNARMIWIGDGPSASRLKLERPDHHFAGVRLHEALAEHYASADLFLFPSLTETYGNVVAEAMASGTPVVAYRSAAAAELVEDGENGALAPPGDDAGFVAAALSTLADRTRLGRLSRAARVSMLPAQLGWCRPRVRAGRAGRDSRRLSLLGKTPRLRRCTLLGRSLTAPASSRGCGRSSAAPLDVLALPA
ncbi:glycosyltransferase family 4 protein [Aromatoleum aromaticum]|uniref:Glycosyl transferase, group 1 family protein n=1 Tax=Aromatoleum aromaticum (strain DSM 19018 / LMG 30748 / EbN1) TaxID=76114 RepID=Q5P061_AROAE|nr:glycosyltransferase family 1 protein [Aromatoleum aromaticum]NMG56248.1 glycosyltransferase [Aromatoleum aromaticum]CAI09303.1 Glycosyl transferase, group 1 family protein [Aromatoleum aromaticum EbN1]